MCFYYVFTTFTTVGYGRTLTFDPYAMRLFQTEFRYGWQGTSAL